MCPVALTSNIKVSPLVIVIVEFSPITRPSLSSPTVLYVDVWLLLTLTTYCWAGNTVLPTPTKLLTSLDGLKFIATEHWIPLPDW